MIVDDEQHAVDVLVSHIQETPFLELKLASTDAVQASVYLQENPVDLLFLDVHMPKLNGLRFMKMVSEKTKIILTTAYTDYALQGYEYGVIDYLVKPIDYDRFLKAVQKMPISKQLIEEAPVATKTTIKLDNDPGYIFVKVEQKGKFMKVNYKDILYVEGLKNYVSIITNEDRIVCYLTVSDMENKLPADRFVRIHKSYIVSIDKVTAIEGNEVVLKKLVRVPMGLTYREHLFNILQDHIYVKKPGGKAE
jgi:DNA-binding LytR/AlgR family response regulator